MFCPKAGPSLQAEKPRLQFFRRQVFHHKLRSQGCCFTRDLIGAVASRCFPHPTLSLAFEQTLQDLKRSRGMSLFTGVQHLCTFNISVVAIPYLSTFCQMFGRGRTPSACPSLLMFRIDHPVARISSSFVPFRPPLWARW